MFLSHSKDESEETIWNLVFLSQNWTTDSLQWFGFDLKLVDIYLESLDLHWFNP